jgi:hypothetical protein
MLDPSYLKFRQSLYRWLLSPDAVRQFLAQENLRINEEMTRAVKQVFRQQQRKPRE